MENSRERGCLITGVLVLQFIGAIFSILSYPINELNKSLSPELAKQFAESNASIAVSTILGVLTIITLIGVFMWKKVAIYVYVALHVIGGIQSFVIGKFSVLNIVSIAVSIGISVLIAYVLLKRMAEEPDNEEL